MFIDTHCHVYIDPLGGQVPEVMERARAAGVTALICPAVDLSSAHTCLRLHRRYPGLYPAVGIHPNHGADAPPDWEHRLRELLEHREVVALGEIGLDYYREYTPFDRQRDLFRVQLRLAREHDLPVIIHNRQAHADALPILRESGVRRGVAHCFSGDRAQAEEWLALGFLISFAGNLTFKNTHLRDVAAAVPLTRTLIETDAPFLSPVPFRGKPNEPARVIYVAETLAMVHGRSREEIAAVTSANARRLFGLEQESAGESGSAHRAPPQ